MVATVRGDIDVECGVVKAQEFDGVVTGFAGETQVFEHDDAALVFTQAQLFQRADHAVGNVAVGFAGRDFEVAWEHGAGQARDYQVTFDKVVGTAHDPAGFVLAYVNTAPVDGFTVGVLFLFQRKDAGNHQRAGHLGTKKVFFFQTD